MFLPFFLNSYFSTLCANSSLHCKVFMFCLSVTLKFEVKHMYIWLKNRLKSVTCKIYCWVYTCTHYLYKNNLTYWCQWLVKHVNYNLIYEMRSSGISWNSMWHFQFSIWLKCSLGTFCWKPHLKRSSGSKVMSDWRVLRTIEHNRNSFLFLAIYHNQCCRLPTNPARSHHISSYTAQ